MTYTVGISTGFWRVARDPALLGLAQKIGGLGATGGIRFVQLDLESVAEFYEPEVKVQVKRMKDKLGMLFVGLHGEIGELMALDSAEKRIWDQTHRRLCQTARYAADLGFFYVNIHMSNKQVISFTEAQHRTQGYFYPVVGPDGKGLQSIIMGNTKIYDEAKKHIPMHTITRSNTFNEEYKKLQQEKLKQLPEILEHIAERELERYPPEQRTDELKKAIKKQHEDKARQDLLDQASNTAYRDERFQFDVWLKLGNSEAEKYQLDDGEWGAFHLVAHWMKEKGDSYWTNIAGGKDPQSLYFENENAFCAAVASKYIEGHFTLKDNPANREFLDGMSIKEWCEAKNLYMLTENPESGEGAEGLYRLFRPEHYYYTIKHINSPKIKICLDFEHMVSQGLDPDVELKKLPDDFGKMVVLFHLGQPVPYGGTAHIPVSRGSLAQEQIYRWLYLMKKKGWKDGYVLFERGGGRTGKGALPQEVFEDTVTALRWIVTFLERDVKPEDLPPEFYGISLQNEPVFARQLVAMREHAWDPLEGLLSVPEEKHTFLGKTAVDKGKGQEWEKRKFR
ncbi:MAG: hypothetical protein WC613_00210 [Candidatus Aenigmatarchaeota archaeon]